MKTRIDAGRENGILAGLFVFQWQRRSPPVQLFRDAVDVCFSSFDDSSSFFCFLLLFCAGRGVAGVSGVLSLLSAAKVNRRRFHTRNKTEAPGRRRDRQASLSCIHSLKNRLITIDLL